MIQFAKETYHFMFKVIVIGDSGVGKTNLILKFGDKNFNIFFKHSNLIFILAQLMKQIK